MLPKKFGGETILKCNSCGHSVKADELDGYRLVKPGKKEEEIAVIDEETKPALPTARLECPKCGHSTAYWWQLQTRSADEPTTRFYRCTRCGHQWREYS